MIKMNAMKSKTQKKMRKLIYHPPKKVKNRMIQKILILTLKNNEKI